MKKIIINLCGLSIFALIVSAITTVTLSNLARNEHPIAAHLGLFPYSPAIIHFEQLHGGFPHDITFVAQCEPSAGRTGFPIVVGLLACAKNSSLDELSSIPTSFLQGRPQPLSTALMKVVLMGEIAERILAGEQSKPENRQTIVALMSQAASLAESTREAIRLEETWTFRKSQINGVNCALSELEAKAKAATSKLLPL